LADRDARTGSAARTQLADLGAEAAPLLWERLLKVEDTMEEGNQRAIQMLAQLVGMARNPTVTPALLEQIKNSELPPDRRTAYENALRFVAGDIRSDLQELAKSDAVPLRLSAVRLLPNAADESAIAALKESLKDADPGVRSWAACGLARSKDADAVPLLKDAAMNSDDVLLQRQSLMSLVQYGEQTALPVLQALLAGEDKAKRWQAFQLLEYFPSPEVTKLVVELAADDPALDSMAPMILYRHANVEAARALGAYLDSDQPRLRAQVQSMLKSMRGVPEAGEILEEFLKRQAEEKAKAEAEKGAKDKPDGGSGKK
jgi:HEAT repeat protein